MNLNAVADQVKQWAERNKAIIALADALAEVGSIEQASTEAKKALVDARAKRDAALVDLGAVAIDAQAARDQAAKVLVDAQAAADKMIEQAHDDADLYRSKANAAAQASADEIVAKATKRADDIAFQAGALKEASRAEGVRLEALRVQATAAAKELQGLEAKIADAKAQIAKILGR